MSGERPPYILAIDAGTEAIKAGLFDVHGRRVALGSRTYPTYFPAPGWAEQDPCRVVGRSGRRCARLFAARQM
jgi:glycerol kinase